jgi:hypothetical protein
VVSLCGTVSAQQDLVEYKEKDDPCARFKMRILVPGNHVDFKRRAEKLKDGIDYKMVWNPCPQAEPQFAFAPAVPAPNRRPRKVWMRMQQKKIQNSSTSLTVMILQTDGHRRVLVP